MWHLEAHLWFLQLSVLLQFCSQGGQSPSQHLRLHVCLRQSRRRLHFRSHVYCFVHGTFKRKGRKMS